MSGQIHKAALTLAFKGFRVFPIAPNEKEPPLLKDFTGRASCNPDDIYDWWSGQPDANIGIATTEIVGGSLLVVDVDTKKGKKGNESLFRLEMEGKTFPPTYTQTTPTGGRHLFYLCPEPVKGGTNVLGDGLDIRSNGGYVVGSGSIVGGGSYSDNDAPLTAAPPWLIEACGRPREKAGTARDQKELSLKAQRQAKGRAQIYLEEQAPLAVEGAAGDQTTFTVACRVKDFGVTKAVALELLLDHWNDRCSPPWAVDDLAAKVENAYRYGAEAAGSSSPESEFKPVSPSVAPAPAASDANLHPFQVLNKEFAFVLAGGGSHILWETTDAKGFYSLEHLATTAFHQKLASKTMALGNGKHQPVTELWMKAPDRRSYDGICFMPGKISPPRFYNLWRGFSVEPGERDTVLPNSAFQALEAFLEHARINVCHGEEKLFNWLMGYFAHLVQRPWEKPLVALVFRGSKGVGKNALIDCIGHLLGNHYLLTSNRRYLIGNFNGHLEKLLLFALDEAFWSGDKQAEGTLKDLITGKTHVIEHKGKEPYAVENCTRVCIIGNEEWLVPATQDERRFAVFDVGDGRKQDRLFFQRMREGMESGGYRLLLRYLLDFDFTQAAVDVNDAPKTAALLAQKLNSLEPFQQWWLQCLTEGRLIGADLSAGVWETDVCKDRLRDAFRRYSRDRNISSRLPEERIVGKLLRTCCPSVDPTQKKREGSERVNIYKLPVLDQARAEWSRYIGHETSWPKD